VHSLAGQQRPLKLSFGHMRALAQGLDPTRHEAKRGLRGICNAQGEACVGAALSAPKSQTARRPFSDLLKSGAPGFSAEIGGGMGPATSVNAFRSAWSDPRRRPGSIRKCHIAVKNANA